MNSNKGFTLVELVVVIVILGILAVTAVPRFIDLSDQAEQAAVDGIAGSISSASAINYAARSASPSAGTATANDTCANAASGLLVGGVPATVTVTGSVGSTGTASSCTVTDADNGSITATATIIGS
ncbi:MAG: prepilin-type N-terminal cleavage/methylation domain-containing protein, partial [Gammaproteobacteria bacterium]|nr:prepilin-type N-terminal cleavage/methylation domain-containing protein [Gammaproteobacteria bacterium]